MTAETWESMCKIMREVTPYGRLELAQSGEPTLHPQLLEFLKIAREITPTTQIQVTTNGINLLNGKITFQQLFEAGANSVYIDMYGSIEKYIALAQDALAQDPEIEWYKYDKVKKLASNPDHRIANTYYGDPKMKLIILQDHPEERIKWRNAGRLSTFLNHVDFDECLPYGLVPVRETYQRKCTLPMRYASLSVDGDYLFCCIDFWCESAGQLGNVSSGVDGFMHFWFGKLMQSIRRHIRVGDRHKVPYCSRCNCAFSKCDWTQMWPDEAYDCFLDRAEWKPMPLSDEEEKALFASGWSWHKETSDSIPSLEKEKEVLITSKKRIIHSDQVIKRKAPKQLTLGL